MRRSLKQHHLVPIFGASLWIVITDDVSADRQRMADVFGECPDKPYFALCSYNARGDFGIFLPRRLLDEETIAHEVFHATHRILEWTCCNFDEKHHEQGALLNGYLSTLVRDAIAADKKRK